MKYRAFISYRHLPLDAAVAQKLHTRLEQHVLPRELRTGGQRKLGRVFRDLNDLPLTHDLSENIREALDESENLIVVCSPQTPASKWVQREIEYFLEHHGRERIFVVLVSGTMAESVPELITSVPAADGSAETRQVEPLAAMIAADTERETFRLLNKEFLRLVAGLIGCPYHRVAQLENRRLFARALLLLSVILLVAAAFIGLLLVKNREAARLLRESQLNEARSAAYAADVLLEEGKRQEAMQSVLAVVSDGTERPYSPDAERALARALGAYEPVVGSYDGEIWQDTDIGQIVISPDAKYLVTFDVNGVLRGYDVAGLTALWTMDVQDLGMTLTPCVTAAGAQGCFVHEEVRALNASQPLLQLETPDQYAYVHFATGEVAAQIAAPYSDCDLRAYSPDGSILVTGSCFKQEDAGGCVFTARNAGTDEVSWQQRLEGEPASKPAEEVSRQFSEAYFREDGSVLLVYMHVAGYPDTRYSCIFAHVSADGTLLNTEKNEGRTIMARTTMHSAGWITLSMRRQALEQEHDAFQKRLEFWRLRAGTFFADGSLFCRLGSLCIEYRLADYSVSSFEAGHYYIDDQGYETLLANGEVRRANAQLGVDVALAAIPTSVVASAQSDGDSSVLCIVHTSAPEVVHLYRFEPNPMMLAYARQREGETVECRSDIPGGKLDAAICAFPRPVLLVSGRSPGNCEARTLQEITYDKQDGASGAALDIMEMQANLDAARRKTAGNIAAEPEAVDAQDASADAYDSEFDLQVAEGDETEREALKAEQENIEAELEAITSELASVEEQVSAAIADSIVVLDPDTVSGKALDTNRYYIGREGWEVLVRYDRSTDEAVATYRLEDCLQGANVSAALINGEQQLLVRIVNEVPDPSKQNILCLFDTASGELLMRYAMEAAADSAEQQFRTVVYPELGRLYVYAVSAGTAGLCIDMATWTVVAEIPAMFAVADNGRAVLCLNSFPALDGEEDAGTAGYCLFLYPVLTLEELVDWAENLPQDSEGEIVIYENNIKRQITLARVF